MIHFWNYCPCAFVKQWYLPFCAFLTTFTIVMTVLIVSTDLKGRRHYIRFNSSYLWEFEDISQESPHLSDIIREKYFFPPVDGPNSKHFTRKPSLQIFNFFRKKRFGTFIECGSEGDGDTEWLERFLNWQGLLTQPQPDMFEKLKSAQRSHTHLAQVCISPTDHPRHAYFKYNESHNESLKAVPCFPLYSLMRAYNTSHLDLLSFVDVTAPIQVLKTLPLRRITIKVIMMRNSESEENKEYGDLCCNSELSALLDKWGYKSTSSCLSFEPTCHFVCARTYCPMLAPALSNDAS